MRPPAIAILIAAAAMPASAQAGDTAPDTPQNSLIADYYAARDQSRLTIGGRIAPGFDNNTDTSLFAQLTYFIDTDIEIGAEFAGWVIFQNDDTVAGSFSLLGRYHFYQQPRYSLFAEASLGVFVAGDDVPDTGTSLNLLPRLGLGGTYQLTKNGDARLIAGFHWHHISNARFDGANNNPSRDAVGLFAGLSWSF